MKKEIKAHVWMCLSVCLYVEVRVCVCVCVCVWQIMLRIVPEVRGACGFSIVHIIAMTHPYVT